MADKIDRTAKGPRFVAYFGPLLDALRQLGGSARPGEAKDEIVRTLNISQQEQSETLKTGQSRFGNQVDWARFYLTKAGCLDASQRGVWALTPKGVATTLTPDESIALSRKVRCGFVADSEQPLTTHDNGERDEEGASPIGLNHRSKLLQMLRTGVSPAGFERLCRRLLREEGFHRVEVTGRSGDGGIDGIGILRINSLVSLKVIFQCKRYSSAIGPNKVRDFRGAMDGRGRQGYYSYHRHLHGSGADRGRTGRRGGDRPH